MTNEQKTKINRGGKMTSLYNFRRPKLRVFLLRSLSEQPVVPGRLEGVQ